MLHELALTFKDVTRLHSELEESHMQIHSNLQQANHLQQAKRKLHVELETMMGSVLISTYFETSSQTKDSVCLAGRTIDLMNAEVCAIDRRLGSCFTDA